MSASDDDVEFIDSQEPHGYPFNDSPAAANPPPQENTTADAAPQSRPLRIYSRAQILALHKSPLVEVPLDMPELKDWFGHENEQNLHKKDYEATPPNSARERRYRRDVDDGEPPARPSFRSALAQPSQMGNFKHQSLRDRDGDTRDKEGLRSLSDKFDRGDRLPVPLNLRNKDRDSLGSNRATSSNPLGSASTRRTEARENGKKKLEAADDWRRGDTRRTEREERERPRSRVRDSSRSRRDSSNSRRDDNDDRRWRDDGRRDERIAARRDKGGDHKDRWPEEREPRTKRGAGREKKSALDDGGKERDDRRGEREKEKEPAWMDTYVPPASATGILSGKAADGELDGIQAWKKNMKEKEQRNANEASDTAAKAKANGEKPLDEIQLFKMLMKKAHTDGPTTPTLEPAPSSGATSSPADANGDKSATSVFAPLGSNQRIRHENPSPHPPPGLEKGHIVDSATPPASASVFQPPPGSRLLAFGRGPGKAVSPSTESPTDTIPTSTSSSTKRPPPQLDLDTPPMSLNRSEKTSFSPFEERGELQSLAPEPQHKERQPLTAESNWQDPVDGKGSRFAKFFDGKPKDPPAPAPSYHPKPQPSVVPHPPSVSGPREQLFSSNETRTMDDLVAMLNTSVQVHRTGPMGSLNTAPPGGNSLNSHQAQNQLHLLQQQHQHQQQQAQLQYIQQQQQNHRIESLYDGRMDNRNFMPDNLVPGLRSAPPPRNRDGGSYPDPLDEVIHLNSQRLPPHRGLDTVYPNGGLGQYPQQQGRIPAGIPPIQQYRGGPSPISNQAALNLQSHRLPPGLANLGGRPPHDPTQFSSGPPGMNPGLHGAPLNGPQSFNNFNNIGYNNPPPRGIPQQHQHSIAQQQLPTLNHQNLMDLRNQGLHQGGNLLNVGNVNGGRNMLAGGYSGPGQQALHPSMRQPAQHAPPQHSSHIGMIPHNIPHQAPPNQQSADLMALLLGGRRD